MQRIWNKGGEHIRKEFYGIVTFSLTVEVELNTGHYRVLLLSGVMWWWQMIMFLLLLKAIRLNSKWRCIIVDTKVVGRLTPNNSVQMMSLQLRDHQDILNDILRRGNVSVVHQFVVQPPAHLWTWSTCFQWNHMFVKSSQLQKSSN